MMNDLARITMDPAVMGGKACIRGLCVTVGTILGFLATRRSREEILRAYPYLEPEDIDRARRVGRPGRRCRTVLRGCRGRPHRGPGKVSHRHGIARAKRREVPTGASRRLAASLGDFPPTTNRSTAILGRTGFVSYNRK
jgi:uncharacterized protein (DUF433 family)